MLRKGRFSFILWNLLAAFSLAGCLLIGGILSLIHGWKGMLANLAGLVLWLVIFLPGSWPTLFLTVTGVAGGALFLEAWAAAWLRRHLGKGSASFFDVAFNGIAAGSAGRAILGRFLGLALAGAAVALPVYGLFRRGGRMALVAMLVYSLAPLAGSALMDMVVLWGWLTGG